MCHSPGYMHKTLKCIIIASVIDRRIFDSKATGWRPKTLGTIITSDLNWKKNTQSLVRQSNKRMSFPHKASKFKSNINDLKRIYMMQVRSKLEQSAVLWHFGLSQKNRKIW